MNKKEKKLKKLLEYYRNNQDTDSLTIQFAIFKEMGKKTYLDDVREEIDGCDMSVLLSILAEVLLMFSVTCVDSDYDWAKDCFEVMAIVKDFEKNNNLLEELDL